MLAGDAPSTLSTISAAAAALLGVSLAVNGFFLRAAFHELRELRDRDRTREVQVARVETRVEALERGRPLPPAPAAARHVRT